jgi:hypothetical protein
MALEPAKLNPFFFDFMIIFIFVAIFLGGGSLILHFAFLSAGLKFFISLRSIPLVVLSTTTLLTIIGRPFQLAKMRRGHWVQEVPGSAAKEAEAADQAWKESKRQEQLFREQFAKESRERAQKAIEQDAFIARARAAEIAMLEQELEELKNTHIELFDEDIREQV